MFLSECLEFCCQTLRASFIPSLKTKRFQFLSVSFYYMYSLPSEHIPRFKSSTLLTLVAFICNLWRAFKCFRQSEYLGSRHSALNATNPLEKLTFCQIQPADFSFFVQWVGLNVKRISFHSGFIEKPVIFSQPCCCWVMAGECPLGKSTSTFSLGYVLPIIMHMEGWNYEIELHNVNPLELEL